MGIPVIGKLVKAFVGSDGIVDAADVQNDSTNQTGVVNGSADIQTAVNRLDGTGVGASIFRFTGPYSASNTNIDQWFNGRQQVRMRCTSNGGISPVFFDLPGTTALNTAFDQLSTAGLPEVLRLIIEYTGTVATFMQIRPRVSPSPQIAGTTSIIVRSGVAATVEVTRVSGTISDYVFTSIGGIGGTAGSALGSVTLINPAVTVWDASTNGSLPSAGVVKGNAYRVVNAPADGSGRFDEPMVNGDWVIWFGETFSNWNVEPHQWLVLPAHDVRRITALEQEYLSDISITPVSDRNSVVRGANYADTAAEIRLKIYATVADYTPEDLNTNGDIDEFTDPSDTEGYLAIRLFGTQSTLAATLPTLYVYNDSSGTFTKLLNMSRDFNHVGDYGVESDYISNETIEYTGGDTIRIYIGEDIDRYNSPNLDIFRNNLSQELQNEITSQAPWAGVAEVFFSNATVRDIHAADRVEYSPGYERGIDWRDMAQSTTINDSRYLDNALDITVNLAAFTINGFGNTIQKLLAIKLQRNDANSGEGAMVEMGAGRAFIRVDTNNHIQVNTSVGAVTPTWSSLGDSFGPVTIGSGGNNWLTFEMLPTTAGHYELVGAIFDGTNYKQLNNVTFTPTGVANGDNLGFSRSASQRGQVLEFKAINSPGYLTHSQLEALLRQHVSDKWDFGFARLYEGSDKKEVDIATLTRFAQDPVTGTAAPTVTPDFIGQRFVDTNNKIIYIAVATGGSGDWEQVN